MPRLRFSIFSGIISTQVTWLPRSAKQVPVTRPTYPVPITQIIDKALTPYKFGIPPKDLDALSYDKSGSYNVPMMGSRYGQMDSHVSLPGWSLLFHVLAKQPVPRRVYTVSHELNE